MRTAEAQSRSRTKQLSSGPSNHAAVAFESHLFVAEVHKLLPAVDARLARHIRAGRNCAGPLHQRLQARHLITVAARLLRTIHSERARVIKRKNKEWMSARQASSLLTGKRGTLRAASRLQRQPPSLQSALFSAKSAKSVKEYNMSQASMKQRAKQGTQIKQRPRARTGDVAASVDTVGCVDASHFRTCSIQSSQSTLIARARRNSKFQQRNQKQSQVAESRSTKPIVSGSHAHPQRWRPCSR